jgi:hypothetical protein
MLMLTVVHICLQLMGGHYVPGHWPSKEVNGVLGNLVCLHYPGEVTGSDGTSSPAICWADYALAPDMTYGTAQGAVWRDFSISFWSSLFKVLSLMHLTLLMLDFEITKAIPLAKRGYVGPCKECV